MELALIDYSQITKRKLFIFLYTGVFTLCFAALFGGRFASSGRGLLERFEAPEWSYWFAVIVMIMSFILLIKAIFSSTAGVGFLVINSTQLKIEKRSGEVYPLDEIQNVKVKANWSTNKIVQDKQNWMLDFDYNGEHYHYDFLLPPEQKNTLLDVLKLDNLRE